MSQEPKVTRFGADPTVDQELATKAYVDNSGGGGIVSDQRVILTSDFTTTSTSFVDVTGMTITLDNRSDGHFIATACFGLIGSLANLFFSMRFVEGSTNHEDMAIRGDDAGAGFTSGGYSTSLTGLLDGDIVKIQTQTSSGTLTVRGVAGIAQSSISILEAS